MKIKRIKIKRFRALEDFSAEFSDFTVIIGENDVGKTSCLHALELFFKRSKISSPQDFFKKLTKLPVEVIVDFLLDKDETTLPQYRDKIRKDILSLKTEWALGESPASEVDMGGRWDKLKPAQYKELIPDDLFFLVPVNRPYTDDFKMTEKALFSKLIRDRLSQILGSEKMKRETDSITSEFRTTVSEIVTELAEMVREQMNNESISISPDVTIDLLKGIDIPLQMSDERVLDIDITRRGAGTQNNCMIALFRLFAKFRTSSFILAMEEPENSLHPRGQRELLWALQAISKNVQILCTTHSQIFLDLGRLENNLILTRQKTGKTVCRTFQAEDTESLREEMGIRISDVLLTGGGNCAIVVEGLTEFNAYAHLMRMAQMDARELGISIVSMYGKGNWKPYARVLDSYGIPFLVVLDKDGEQTERDILREQERGKLKSLKGVFRLSEGMFEDYLPLNLMADVLNEEFPQGEVVKESDFDSSKHGKARQSNIEAVLYKKKPSDVRIEYEKIKIGVKVCKKMADAKHNLHDDYRAVFAKAKEIVEQF
jgi:putative ATP-dependent endonuclease of the OLD family